MDEALDLYERTRRFALSCLSFSRMLPRHPDSQIYITQLLRSSASVAANYRAARRGRSRDEFIAKLGIVLEEIDESVHWLEFMREGMIGVNDALEAEAKELCAIFTTAVKTARRNRGR